MKTLLLSALLLFTSYAHAYNIEELSQATASATYITTIDCDYKGVTYRCAIIRYEDIVYAVAYDEDAEVQYIATTPSEKYPDGLVPVEDLMRAGSI